MLNARMFQNLKPANDLGAIADNLIVTISRIRSLQTRTQVRGNFCPYGLSKKILT